MTKEEARASDDRREIMRNQVVIMDALHLVMLSVGSPVGSDGWDVRRELGRRINVTKQRIEP